MYRQYVAGDKSGGRQTALVVPRNHSRQTAFISPKFHSVQLSPLFPSFVYTATAFKGCGNKAMATSTGRHMRQPAFIPANREPNLQKETNGSSHIQTLTRDTGHRSPYFFLHNHHKLTPFCNRTHDHSHLQLRILQPLHCRLVQCRTWPVLTRKCPSFLPRSIPSNPAFSSSFITFLQTLSRQISTPAYSNTLQD